MRCWSPPPGSSDWDSASASPRGSIFVPAPAQGAIALQVRAGSAIEPSCSAASDEDTFLSVLAERTVLAEMGGGCRLPLGAWARMEGGALLLTAAIAIDGAVRKVDVSGSPTREGALDVGRRAVALLQAGHE
jgi:hydroxymethylbilane synthase